MALQTAVLQGGTTLGTSSVALYTVPTGKSAWVKRAVFTNTSAGSVNLTVSVARSGGGSLVLIAAFPIGAGAAYVSPELSSLALNAGDVVAAFASAASSINCVMSGLVQ